MNSYKLKDITPENNLNTNSKNLITIPIKINENTTTNTNYSYEYSLNNIIFDPCQSSPPNIFMQKLEKRFRSYNSSGIK